MRRITFALVTMVVCAGAGVARADEQGAPSEGAHQRTGMLIGFGVGGGNISADCAADSGGICDEVLESGSFDFHIGSMLRPRLAVMFDLWPMVYHEDALTITHVIFTGAARYWLTPRLWIQGGVGGANARFEYNGVFVQDETRTDTVFGVMAGIGYELLLRHDFALDIQLRGGTGFYQDDEIKGKNAALQAGFTWY